MGVLLVMILGQRGDLSVCVEGYRHFIALYIRNCTHYILLNSFISFKADD
jgi:hypothetical protein